MTLKAVIVVILLAAIIVPVVLAEVRRLRTRAPRRQPPPTRAPKREVAAKPKLKLLVNKQDMDRELAALLAQNRKAGEGDE